MRPSVQVEGKPAPVGAWLSLFKDDGDSVGLYIILLKAAKTAGSNTADNEVKNLETLWVPDGSGGYVQKDSPLAPNKSYLIPLTAAVACGPMDANGCKNPNIRAGELSALFTFVFAYR